MLGTIRRHLGTAAGDLAMQAALEPSPPAPFRLEQSWAIS
jgi:hypothetical protein